MGIRCSSNMTPGMTVVTIRVLQRPALHVPAGGQHGRGPDQRGGERFDIAFDHDEEKFAGNVIRVAPATCDHGRRCVT
jgi:hypothetical protein